MKKANNLINESSPYLLQHAHNPVNWYAWGDEAFAKAAQEKKLVLISIGYSACHWCHVMEHESFEDEPTAQLMNNNFICIKVDREERPDVDNIYMHAVQLMTGRGGWPLNCFALPDARPVYGGTYFPKTQWQNILQQLSSMYKNEPNKFEQYGEELTEGIKRADLLQFEKSADTFSKDTLIESVKNWKERFDNIDGGPQKAPKFALPNNYIFLLRYGVLNNDSAVIAHVKLTLDKMSFGGIYDHLAGGFARYSTDSLWKVPHFEKMLYDNAQLISLYSEAYNYFKEPLYKKVVEETIDFVFNELMSDEGFFYSALDADSEGVEGKFYVWKKDEIEEVISSLNISKFTTLHLFEIIQDYFSINENGFWEHDNYILLRTEFDETICSKHQLSANNLNEIISIVKQALLQKRNERVKPGLDDKSLTSWNALMVIALCDAYNFLQVEKFLKAALKTMGVILKKQKQNTGKLYHSYKNGKSSIAGFLEDYCFTIEALLKLYESTFNETWLQEAKAMLDYVIEHFQNKKTGMFYFNANDDDNLITRKTESQDNVIPASNSSIAKSLFYLGKHFDNINHINTSQTMLHYFAEEIKHYGSAYSNWSLLGLHLTFPFYEIAFTGDRALGLKKEFMQSYSPNTIVAGSTLKSSLPLLKDRVIEGKSLIYVCEHGSCQLPLTSIEEVKKLISV